MSNTKDQDSKKEPTFIFRYFYRKFRNLLDLKRDSETESAVVESITSNVSFTGSNLWILGFAIIIASVGLNVNSPAVIIGAMLISPLMGPIMGAGLALGINDFQLLKRSLFHLGVATAMGLFASTVYFLISPINSAASELLARTTPTIYDILIAFFGGLTGIIAGTRKSKGNAIPGVAIATALIPPLCTAGFGIASGEFKFFFGAFYLYMINCVFICMATLLMVRYFKFHFKEQTNAKLAKKIRIIITSLIILMILPSSYLAYTLVIKNRFNQNVSQFIKDNFENRNYTIVLKEIEYDSTPRKIRLGFLVERLSQKDIVSLNNTLPDYGLNNTVLEIVQEEESKGDINELRADILEELYGHNQAALTSKDDQIRLLENELKKREEQIYPSQKLIKEVKTLFPQVRSLSVADHIRASYKDSVTIISDTTTLIIIKADSTLRQQDEKRIRQWLKERLSLKKAKVIRE